MNNDLFTESDLSWKQNANCYGIDTDLFFPERGVSSSNAKSVCEGCTVKQECLEYALANGEKFGIWGGLSERERRVLRSERRMRRHKKHTNERNHMDERTYIDEHSHMDDRMDENFEITPLRATN